MSEGDILSEDLEDEVVEEAFEPTFDDQILELDHSYGYDCKRLFNLVLIDDDTLVFASGNYIHYFSISRKEVTFRATQFGAGIGFITKNEHPDFVGLLTVAENGRQPTVFVYEFPSHNVRVQLEGAAKAQFTCGSYNSTGDLFASQAGYPDFMLTIWRWQTAEVILRSKSFQNDVLHVHFSLFNPILLCTCGLSHIKFWKMANTFTGLKLQGDLGRFGKTDFSDIYAIFMLSDENVISGSDWGNMLLWEAGLIKFEICRKARAPCHAKPITRITMENGMVTTVGMDGYVRMWYWETVDLADPPDDDRFVEIEPVYEFQVGSCEIRGLQKIKSFDNTNFEYYAQDGKGGFWYCDLNPDEVPNEPYKLYSCHGGKVIAVQTSPVSPHLATLGEDGKMFVYNYKEQKLVLEKDFNSVGTDLIWFSNKISNCGMELLIAFEDGIVRQMLLHLQKGENPRLELVRAVKAHTEKITKMSINPKESLLVTGSTDQTVFFYMILELTSNFVNFKPSGFIKLDAVACSFNWRHDKSHTVLIGCQTGEVFEYVLPARVTEDQVALTYNLTEEDRKHSTRFVSIKSRIRRDLRREEIKRRKEKKRARKLREVEKLKAANPGLQIDLESALADSEPEEDEPPLHIPTIPNPVLWLRYTERETIWTSMAGFDAGYIYELKFGAPEPVYATIIKDGDDCEIHSYLVIDAYLIFGLVNGKIRINYIDPADFTDLRNYRLFSMHDALKGIIPRILPSYDGAYIFSVGHDGNIFSYKWNGPHVVSSTRRKIDVLPKLPEPAIDITDADYPSLEQEKINAEIKRKEDAAAAHDRLVLEKIAELQVRYNAIMKEHDKLPKELQMPLKTLLLDERITKEIADELQAELDDVREDLAYDLEVAMVGKQKLYDYFLKDLDHIPITISSLKDNEEGVNTFRLKSLGADYEQMRRDIEERLKMEAGRRGPAEPTFGDEKSDSIPEPPVEAFFFGRDPNTIIPRFSKKMLRLLKSYRSRQLYEIDRIFHWEKLERQRPDPNKNHPDDDAKIKEAERTLGDYKLKIGADYEPKSKENFTHKYIEIANNFEKRFRLCDEFNKEVFELRQQKKELYEFAEESEKKLQRLHKLIPARNRKFFPKLPPIDYNKEYPELNLVEHCKPGLGIEIADILYLEKTVAELLPPEETASEKTAPEEIVETEEMEDSINSEAVLDVHLYYALKCNEVEYVPEHEEMADILAKLPDVFDPAYYEVQEGKPSPWLIDLQNNFLISKLHEQASILSEVQRKIDDFEEDLERVKIKRLEVQFRADFMQSYMITMNQELIIMRDSEQIENQLLTKADDAMRTRNAMQKTINQVNRQIEESRKMCERINEQIISVQLKFLNSVKTHKFFDFLRRIFKKKWREPKPPKEGDESSESSSEDSSSSEDEDDDTKSVDSTDMTAIRLDEATCPAGLERSTYEAAFKMRADRHALERSLAEQQKTIEARRVEVNELGKQMKYHEEVYAREKATLLEFRRKRQQELNKVNINIVLRMNQIQHFYPGDNPYDVSQAVLFDARSLVSLKSRVSELNVETAENKRIYRCNVVHLRRMNADISFMRAEITRLEGEIKEEMMRKFGMVLNLDDLEEEVLRKYVFDLETDPEMEYRLIEKEMERRNKELEALEKEFIRINEENTMKLNVHRVLQEENNRLDEILVKQEKNYDKWVNYKGLDLDRDIEKLLAIDKEQTERIKCLEREICSLRLKGKPLQLDEGAKAEGEEGACPEMLAADAYTLRLVPDEFIMGRLYILVQKFFVKHLSKHMSKDNIRKYSHKAARYLGQAGYSFQGEITERIMGCITEQMREIVPKKYAVHLSDEDVSQLFKDVLSTIDYERSEINTADVVKGIYQNATESVPVEKLNKTQYILEQVFKDLVEVLPPEEFTCDETRNVLEEMMMKDTRIDPRCINVEKLIKEVCNFAKENLLDNITALPVRRLTELLGRSLCKRKKDLLMTSCSAYSVSAD